MQHVFMLRTRTQDARDWFASQDHLQLLQARQALKYIRREALQLIVIEEPEHRK